MRRPLYGGFILICDSQSSPQYCSLSPGKPGAVGQTSVCGGLQPASARLPANDVKPAAGGLKRELQNSVEPPGGADAPVPARRAPRAPWPAFRVVEDIDSSSG